MKKVYLSIFAIFTGVVSFAQTVSNGDMEVWRTNMSGAVIPKSIHAPQQWFGADSTIIALGQIFGSGAGVPPSEWKSQVYQESSIVHGGANAAKILTVTQDTMGLLGIFPGVLSNAKVVVPISLSGGTPSVGAISYTGGTPVSLRIKTVSAWVEYFPGKDSTTGMFGGNDTAMLTVQAVSRIHGVDSIVGFGFVAIPPYSSYTQVTANVSYPVDSLNPVDTIRIVFASSGGARRNLDSSILYVDDVTMTGVPQGLSVNNTAGKDALVKVFPNPAAGIVNFYGPANAALVCTIRSASGRVVATRAFSGATTVDVAALSAGLYFYTITDNTGAAIQHGKLTVSH